MEVIYLIINLLSLFFGIVSTDFCVGSLNPCLKMAHVLRMVVWIWLRFGCGCSNFEQIGEWKDWIYLQILYLVRSDAVIWICATCRDLVQERQWHGIASPAVNLSYGLQFPTICLLWVGKWQWWMLSVGRSRLLVEFAIEVIYLNSIFCFVLMLNLSCDWWPLCRILVG